MTTSNRSTAPGPKQRPVGLTQDAGWQIGVSRTIHVPLEVTWAFLTSNEGVPLWLGDGVSLPAAAGDRYRTSDGIAGEFRSFREHDRVRLTWQPRDWDHEATLQLAVTGDATQTMIRFHQERLANAEERERMREHWRRVLDAVIEALTPSS